MRITLRHVLLFSALFAPSALASEPQVNADMYDFAKAIADSMTGPSTGHDPNFRRSVTLARNANGELVVSSMQIGGGDRALTIPSGSVGVIIAHVSGQCALPYGSDDSAARQGITVMTIGGSRNDVWEVGKIESGVSVRLVKDAHQPGPWESYQQDPAKYATYNCDTYK